MLVCVSELSLTDAVRIMICYDDVLINYTLIALVYRMNLMREFEGI